MFTAALREQDLLDNSTISNIQALLVYAFSLELEKGTAASKTWNLLGVAIRMAQVSATTSNNRTFAEPRFLPDRTSDCIANSAVNPRSTRKQITPSCDDVSGEDA